MHRSSKLPLKTPVSNREWMHLVVFIVIRLLEQEVRGELLVLVACEIGLDGEVTVETKAAKLGFLLASSLRQSYWDNLLSQWPRTPPR